jgi:hypothetical protein
MEKTLERRRSIEGVLPIGRSTSTGRTKLAQLVVARARGEERAPVERSLTDETHELDLVLGQGGRRSRVDLRSQVRLDGGGGEIPQEVPDAVHLPIVSWRAVVKGSSDRWARRSARSGEAAERDVMQTADVGSGRRLGHDVNDNHRA